MQREILSKESVKSGYGVNKYIVKYKGEWNDIALINCIDLNKNIPSELYYLYYSTLDHSSNYGGYVEKISIDEKGITTAIVGVYYD